MEKNTISVVIVDDHPVISYGLSAFFMREEGFVVAGEAKEPDEAIEIVEITQPDIVILDISLKGSDGIDLIERFKKISPHSKVIMYTMHCNLNLISWSLKAGALGYMLKSDKTSELIEAIRKVIDGRVYLSSSIPESLLSRLSKDI